MLNLSSLLPPLRVHSWGGLGSQLNALAFTLDFLAISPGRRVHLVIHTGGVTRRYMEIAEILPSNIIWREINDFVHNANAQKSKNGLRHSASMLSSQLRIIVFPERNRDFAKITLWTISSRGHYSYMSFSENTIHKLFELITKSSAKSRDCENVIHYRLGDLLSVGKGFVEPSNIIHLANSMGIKQWHVLTDSPVEARKMFNDLSSKHSIADVYDLAPLALIKTGVQSRIFVGTTSKLSIWICVFRVHLNSGVTFMPKQLKANLKQLFKGQIPINLDFY